MPTNAPQENKPAKAPKATKAKPEHKPAKAPKAPPKPKAETVEYYDPFELRLVGIDPFHPARGPHDTPVVDSYGDLEPFADPDRLRAAEIDAYADAAYSVAKHGVKTPILIAIHDGKPYVTDGRQRVLWARLATMTLKTDGDDFGVRVPAVLDKSKDAVVSLVVCNEHRKETTVVSKARNAERLRLRGYSDSEIREFFGVTRQTLDNWRLLMACEESIIARVESGEIPIQAAVQLGKLPAHEQAPALAIIEAEGGTLKGHGGVENVARAAEAVRGQAEHESAAEADVEPAIDGDCFEDDLPGSEDAGEVEEAQPAAPPAPPRMVREGVRRMGNVAQMKARAKLAEAIEGKSINARDLNFDDNAIAAVLFAMRKIAGEDVDLSVWPAIAEAFGDA